MKGRKKAPLEEFPDTFPKAEVTDDFHYTIKRSNIMEEEPIPTRPKHITEVIEILAQAAKEYFERHPDELAELAGQELLNEMAFLAGTKAAEEVLNKDKKE